MKCPKCNNEMESGYIQCREMIWTTEKDTVYTPDLRRGDIRIRSSFNGTIVQSDICKSCKIVLVNYVKCPDHQKSVWDITK